MLEQIQQPWHKSSIWPAPTKLSNPYLHGRQTLDDGDDDDENRIRSLPKLKLL